MPRLSHAVRVLALLLAALQLSSRVAATWADARLVGAVARAAAEGRLVHAESDRSADCTRVHGPDCEFCRVVAASEDRTGARPLLPLVVASAVVPTEAVAARAPAPYDGPESARPPPAA